MISMLLVCIHLSEPKMRGEKSERQLAFRRELEGNVFKTDRLKEHLTEESNRVPYEDPFLSEPALNSLDMIRQDGRNRASGKMNSVMKDTFAAGATTYTNSPTEGPRPNTAAPILYLAPKNKANKGKNSASASSPPGKGNPASKSMMGKSSASGKSNKNIGKSVGKSAMSTVGPGTAYPTMAPSKLGMPSSSLTPRPTCPPGSSFFPPDVSGFFGSQSSGGSKLQMELESVLNQIQVPAAFGDQCIHR